MKQSTTPPKLLGKNWIEDRRTAPVIVGVIVGVGVAVFLSFM